MHSERDTKCMAKNWSGNGLAPLKQTYGSISRPKHPKHPKFDGLTRPDPKWLSPSLKNPNEKC
ncbi:hypothetical protein NECAME_04444 [Necator americanus]|uniref:Uncharacterized protein n=1 Tax=Necator americanus TaxID=51031 RepID=W2SV20_NECAM|nr:hypothetical protein NECAME_04444 [Necator americanus]ETN72547.1 hypothetical protein NECAME_04444 [Necator americanus]